MAKNDPIAVKKININSIKEVPWQSPGGKYAASFQGISEALGREPASLDLSKRHPFDLEWTRVPPGKANFPYHAHSAQWELYLMISGKATVRHKEGRTEVSTGDAFIFGTDEPHQRINSGADDLIYYVIAATPIGEPGYSPDSGKWKVTKSSAADRAVLKARKTANLNGA